MSHSINELLIQPATLAGKDNYLYYILITTYCQLVQDEGIFLCNSNPLDWTFKILKLVSAVVLYTLNCIA